jgi:hydrogenase-4 component E
MDTSWIMWLFAAELGSAILAAELRNLRRATLALALQSLLLVAIISTFGYLSGISYFYWWAIVAFVVRVLLIPLLLWKFSRRDPFLEVDPLLGLIPSLILLSILLPLTFLFLYTYLCPYFLEFLPAPYSGIGEAAGLNLAFGLTVMVLGIYVLLVKRDIIKVVMGLLLMENGVQWALVSPGPTIHEAAEIGIACNLVIASWILLYLSTKIYERWGRKDTAFLSELKR